MNVIKQVGIKIKTLVTRLIEKDNTTCLDNILLGCLFLLSLAFKAIIHMRRLSKNNNAKKKLPLATVCVGNITVGGSGKTPMIMALAKECSKQFKVAVISKGYLGTKVKKNKVKEVFDSDSCQFYGDEPVMIKNKCPDVSVFVSKDRHLALSYAYEKGCEVAFLDDGFQDLSLKPDLNVLMVKSIDPIRKGYFLPRGYLRDNPSILNKATYIGLSQSESEKDFNTRKQFIENFATAPQFGLSSKNFAIKGMANASLSELKGSKVAVFSAIANPKSFENTISSLGASIIESFHKVDHSAFEKSELISFVEHAKQTGAKYILCTHKDYVKLSKDLKSSYPIFYIDYTTEPSYQRETFSNLLEDISQIIKSYKIKREISL